MKVFISWSGKLSHQVACIFREWLPSVIQSITPYVSSEDIDKGARWSTDIAGELEESDFGIICVTGENVGAPWVNFEAGALSKKLDKARVVPFLFDIKGSEVQGPLLQFQSTIYEESDVYRMVETINDCLIESDRLGEGQLKKTFGVWWPLLKESLDGIEAESGEAAPGEGDEARNQGEILEELLELVRSQQRLLNSPESPMPSDYLSWALNTPGAIPVFEDEDMLKKISELHSYVLTMEAPIRGFAEDDPTGKYTEILGGIEHIKKLAEEALLIPKQPIRRRTFYDKQGNKVTQIVNVELERNRRRSAGRRLAENLDVGARRLGPQ